MIFFCIGWFGVGLAFVLSSTLNWKLAFVVAIFVPIDIVGVRTKAMINLNEISSIENASRISAETIESIRTVVSLGREKYFLENFKAYFEKKKTKTFLVFHVQALFYAVSLSLIYFIQTTAYAYGLYLLKNNEISSANIIGIFSMISLSSYFLSRSYVQLPDQKKAKVCNKNTFNLIERNSKIDSMSTSGLK